MPRIAIVTPMLPVPHDQTRGRYIHETARALGSLAQVRVFFMQLRYPNVPGLAPRSFLAGQVGPDYRLPGVEVDVFSYPAVPGLSRVVNGLVGSWALLRRLRAYAPDLVLGYWIYPDGYAALRASRKLGVPCVIGALGSDIHMRSGFNAYMTRRTIKGIDALLTVSETMRRTAIADFGAAPEKVHTIINGYNTTVFQPFPQMQMRQLLGIAANAKLIIYAGRFVEAKGMRELVTAFRQLAARDPLAQLALVGDGVMRVELVRAIRDAGLTDRVLMPGGLAPEQVAQWICAADVLTLPSWSEGYPNVVVEACACGRPVVATDVGGTHEIINDSNGILIAPRDASALCRALEQALVQPWDHAAIATAMTRTWDEVARETLAVCVDVLAKTGSAKVRRPNH